MAAGRGGVPPGVWTVGVATSVVVLAFAMLNPVLAVRLQQAGEPATLIGLFAALPFAGIALSVPAMPVVFERLGVATAYRLGLALEALGTLGYTLTDDPIAWCVLAAVGGIGAAAVWTGTEAIIAHHAPPQRRGRITGLYQTALGAAIALGPMLPGLVAPFTRSPQALTWIALVLLLVLLLVALAATLGPAVGALRAWSAQSQAADRRLLPALRAVPALVWIAFVGGVFEAGLGSITTAYGAHLGLTLAVAASIAGAAGIGSFVLQLPAGWLADRLAPQRLFGGAAVVLAAGSVVFAAATAWPPALWGSAFVWGAVGGTLYTLTMIRVAHRFADRSAMAGTAAVITGYTLGGVVGPLVSGAVLEVSGVTGQAAWLTALALSVLVLLRRAQL
jgi:MFS family permease